MPGAASRVLCCVGKPYSAGFSVVLPCKGSQALLTGGCAGCACGELLTLATPPAAASACSLPSARAASGRNASTTELYRASAGRLHEKNSTTQFGHGASAFRRLGPRAILPLTILARFRERLGVQPKQEKLGMAPARCQPAAAAAAALSALSAPRLVESTASRVLKKVADPPTPSKISTADAAFRTAS